MDVFILDNCLDIQIQILEMPSLFSYIIVKGKKSYLTVFWIWLLWVVCHLLNESKVKRVSFLFHKGANKMLVDKGELVTTQNFCKMVGLFCAVVIYELNEKIVSICLWWAMHQKLNCTWQRNIFHFAFIKWNIIVKKIV